MRQIVANHRRLLVRGLAGVAVVGALVWVARPDVPDIGCPGLGVASITYGDDGGFASREEAVSHSVEAVYGVNVDPGSLILTRLERNKLRVEVRNGDDVLGGSISGSYPNYVANGVHCLIEPRQTESS